MNCQNNFKRREEGKTQYIFIYGYMTSDLQLRTTQIVREETRTSS